MKFLHTADWHIGRKLNGFSLLEEQEYAFNQLMEVAKKEEVDAIVIAGDLYDRSVPSIEAVALFNHMMKEMNLIEGFPVLAISGNHDSSTRLDTGSPWLKEQQFHLHTQLEQSFEPVEMLGVQFYLLPYFEPFHVRQVFNNEIRDIQSGMKLVIKKMKESFDSSKKQVLVSHFFAAGSLRSDSETPVEVGGLDSVPLELLKDFDYVALGHLHDKNAIKKEEHIQYSGALLKYSLSEEKQEKGIRVIEITEEGVSNRFVPLKPLRDVRRLVESFETLTSPSFYETINREDYLAISLTDTTIIFNALQELRLIYPFIISLDRATKDKKEDNLNETTQQMKTLKPEDIMANYFEEVTGKELSTQQKMWLDELMIENNREK